ncbi:MAG: tail fiber domain-containing protein [Flavobacteriales bacterium]|nr:tail fiber domain-containing protein [Flavobacteriales bacterium]
MRNFRLFLIVFLDLWFSFTIKAQWINATPLQSIQLDPNNYKLVGIGTSSPQAPLHIIGDGVANAQGWQKSIILDNNAALIWKGSQNSFFMAHPSNTPAGDFYQGISAGIGSGAAVTYTGKVFAANTPPAGVPQGSTQLYRNLIVLDFDGGTTKRSLGVNILVPKRSADIVNNGNTAADAQLRLTHTAHNNPNRGIWTDFQTTNLGNLYINPRRFQNGQSIQRNVGIAIRKPERRLDVYDSLNAQLRLTANTSFSNVSYTDIKTTNHLNNNFGGGHLLINPTWGFAKGFVAINMLDSNTALNTDLALYVNGQQNLRYAKEGDTSHVRVMVWDSINNGRVKWRHADSLADKDWLIYGTTNKIPHSIGDHIYTQNKVNIEASGNGGVSSGLLNINQSSGIGVHVRVTSLGDGVVARINNGTAMLGSTFSGIGVWGSSPQGIGNYAIYSDGNLYINGIGTGNNGQFYASDQQFKTNIDTITNASAIISQLAPKSFFYDTLNSVNMRFSSKKQYGFIAQDVEQFMPELVGSTTKPAEYDSLGNLLYPAVTFKTMNYNAYFAILTKALQEQNDSIAKMNSLNNSQQSSIDSLYRTKQP